ncbi:N-formylglutamate amidohydrolase [Limibacillus halophilus]|uniref:Putative N-formylglutamate amidohydrolase n=1 Tax=Limibacillus halophilus TaxID=1579333 RepID=A0A839SV11_9PROT|nr:N-formylglutamate amidohydrolase [Limibacillus halophilus]MBB3066158.1 putative N-formylglutamate amidohydrolase [Limibacillus halophilus]
MLQTVQAEALFLTADDPDPVGTINAEGGSPFFLTCEHAGRLVPARLGDLGVATAEMERHIAYDLGALALAERLSVILDASLIVQRYSRLVVDCNRPFEAPGCIPTVSDGTEVPRNQNISAQERRQRYAEIHQPFHNAIRDALDERNRRGVPGVLVSVHSFTPCLSVSGSPRPWHLGALSNRDNRFARAFLNAFQQDNPEIVCAHNEPYKVSDQTDFTIPVHGERRGLPHILLEVRNDLIVDPQDQADWAERIAKALGTAKQSQL